MLGLQSLSSIAVVTSGHGYVPDLRADIVMQSSGPNAEVTGKPTHQDLAPKSVHSKTEFPPLYVLIKYNTLYLQRLLWENLGVTLLGRVNLANALKVFVVVLGFLFAPTLGGLTCEEV
jgi:hypothetical protein